MTHKETLQRLIDLGWDGENVEMFGALSRQWLVVNDLHTIKTLMKNQPFRLTRAEVEKRTGRKVIEWREPKNGDVYYSGIIDIAREASSDLDGPRWILGDKLDAPCVCGQQDCLACLGEAAPEQPHTHDNFGGGGRSNCKACQADQIADLRERVAELEKQRLIREATKHEWEDYDQHAVKYTDGIVKLEDARRTIESIRSKESPDARDS